MKPIKTTIAVLFAILTLAACTENQTVIEPMRQQTLPAQTNSEADTTQLDRTQDTRTTDMMRLPTPGQNRSRVVPVNGSGSGNGSGGSSAPATPRTDSPVQTVMPVDSLTK